MDSKDPAPMPGCMVPSIAWLCRVPVDSCFCSERWRVVGICGIPEPPKVAAVALEVAGSVEKEAPAVAAELPSVEKPLPIEATAGFESGAKEPMEMTAGVVVGSRPCIGKELG